MDQRIIDNVEVFTLAGQVGFKRLDGKGKIGVDLEELVDFLREKNLANWRTGDKVVKKGIRYCWVENQGYEELTEMFPIDDLLTYIKQGGKPHEPKLMFPPTPTASSDEQGREDLWFRVLEATGSVEDADRVIGRPWAVKEGAQDGATATKMLEMEDRFGDNFRLHGLAGVLSITTFEEDAHTSASLTAESARKVRDYIDAWLKGQG